MSSTIELTHCRLEPDKEPELVPGTPFMQPLT
jgi:hypothetical protein